MAEKFVHRVQLDGVYKDRDNRFALTALVAETLAIYYWCEAFAEGRPPRFVVIGQRGLAEYAVKATAAIIKHVAKITESLNETEGFKFGAVIAMRDALRVRREKEQRRPEYMDQCNVSTYRAKVSLGKYYKVGVKDVKTEFDLEGFQRGQKQVWTLKTLKTPTQVLDNYVRRHRDDSSEDHS